MCFLLRTVALAIPPEIDSLCFGTDICFAVISSTFPGKRSSVRLLQ